MIKQFGIGWFGSQQRFYQSIKNLVNTETYIDITAGGNGVPYRMLAGGDVLKVVTNDLSFYSYVCAKSVFMSTPMKNEELSYCLVADPIEGYISTKDAGSKFSFFSPLIRRYIDGFCLKNRNNPIALAGMGKLLLADCTFRGTSFCRKTSEGINLEEISLEEFKKLLLPKLEYFNTRIIGGGESYNYNANDFVKIFEGFRGATVYSDPAWPGRPIKNKTGMDNPYHVSSEIIPSILQQEDSSLRLPWSHRDIFAKPTFTQHYIEDSYIMERKIVEDVILWIDTALSKGAAQFILNTQSTNFPDEKRLAEILNKYEFTVERFENIKGNHTHRFDETWFIITGIK